MSDNQKVPAEMILELRRRRPAHSLAALIEAVEDGLQKEEVSIIQFLHALLEAFPELRLGEMKTISQLEYFGGELSEEQVLALIDNLIFGPAGQ